MHDLAFKPKSSDTSTLRGGKASEAQDVISLAPSFATDQPNGIFRKASCPCGGGCPACQTKSNDLKVSQPNDPAEIEADRVADKVMRMPVGEVNRDKKGTSSLASQKVSVHLAPLSSAHIPTVHRKEAVTGAAPKPPPDYTPPSIIDVMKSGGQPIDRETRSFFEPRFGHDLGHVRVHTDTFAAQTARSISAKAYTLGSNIVFGSGEYRPDSESGRHLLAHELAHTIQQSNLSDTLPSSVPHVSIDIRSSGVGLSRTPDLDEERRKAVAEAEAVIASMHDDDEDEPVAITSLAISKKGLSRPIVKPAAKVAKRTSCPGGAMPYMGVCMSDEILETLPQADFDLKQAQKIVLTHAGKAERAQKRRDLTIKRFGPNLPVADYQKAIEQYLSNQDHRTRREYLAALDRLELRYQHQVDLFLKNPEWRDRYDLLTLQKIVAEHSPQIAATRVQDVNEYLSMPNWTAGEQVQMDRLKNDIKGWTDEEQKLARNLLWRWFELTREGQHSSAAKDIIIKMTEQRLDQWLHAADKAREEDCKKNPTGTVEKLYRLHGIDRCKPWFDEENQSPYFHGPSELHDFRMQTRIRLSEDESPQSLVFECVKEYRRHTNIEEQLRTMQAQAMVGLAVHYTLIGSTYLEAQNNTAPASKIMNLPANGVGRIIDTPMGPQRVRAIMPNGDFVLDPIVNAPRADRALTSGSTGSAIVPAAKSPVWTDAPNPGILMAPQANPFGEQASLPPGSIFLLGPPASMPSVVRDGPMRSQPGGGNRSTYISTLNTGTQSKEPAPSVEILPRGTVPMSDFELPEPGHYIRRKPPDESIRPQILANAGHTTDGRLRDTNTGRALNEGEAVWGHGPDFQFAQMRDLFEKQGKSQAEFDAFYLDPAKWQIEYGPTNSSRVFDHIPRQRPVH